jgi:hypothetical protein
MDRVEQVRYPVDRAIEKIAVDERYRPLARLSRLELRRLLAEAHYCEVRALKAEIEAERTGAERHDEERDKAERHHAAPDNAEG